MASLTDHLSELVEDADAVLLFSPTASFHDRFTGDEAGGRSDERTDIVVVAPDNDVDADPFVELPIPFRDVRDRIRFGVEGSMEADLVAEGDEVVCVVSVFEGESDAVIRVTVDETVHTGIYDLFVESRADPGVIRDVLEVAIELGKKGQKGKPVGALFVVGDAGKVMNKSRSLSYNPFEKSHVHVGDPIVNVMLKEFSRLDGAFVISDSGKIVSAYRYLEPAAEGVDIPKGLGARHMAGGAITQDTNATAIVLSESDGLVRAFKGGRLVLEIDPEEY
ncbi:MULTISPECIES: diadenylate cyclase DacZ [Haloferacaceae]|uniref:Diadenylate cyclase n=1 Tax=Halorubrum glutamatedens TaxID=2707018 RepID=A0ABD5QVA3_9EURY|nr:diadenylate cyclase DacZ [Halobellus captivus]